MKKHISSLSLILILLSLTFITAVPQLPMIITGEVYINEKPAKIGTEITVILKGDEVVQTEITEKGKFNLLLQKLSEGDEVEFYVDNINSEESVIYQSGDFKQLTLKVEKSYLIYYFGGVMLLLVIGFLIWKRKRK